MPARRSSRTLAKVVDIRLVQRQAAEAEVVKAAQALALMQSQRTQTLARLDKTVALWSQVITVPSMPMHLMGALGTVVLEQEKVLVRAEADIRMAETKKARLAEMWRETLAAEQAAKSLAKSARRVELRRREEAALHEVSERTARQPRP